jgi:microcystin-dependent protein
MSDYPAVLPIQQFFDDNGAPLAGGKLYSYAAGTSTPQATYADAGGTPNVNPIILDASGRATYYLPTGVGYKFNLTDASNVQVTGYPVDNVMIPSPSAPPAPAAVPTGAILPYGGTSAPTSYLLCDGTAVDRSTYAALFSVLGTAYGAGDGSTTFNLPDLQQRFPLGKAASGTGNTLGSAGGAIDHTHAYTQVLNHTHTVTVTDPGHTHTQNSHSHAVTDPGHYHTFFGDNIGITSGSDDYAIRSSGSANTSTETTGVTVGSATATNQNATTGITASTANPSGGVASGTTASNNPPYQVVNYIIKT